MSTFNRRFYHNIKPRLDNFLNKVPSTKSLINHDIEVLDEYFKKKNFIAVRAHLIKIYEVLLSEDYLTDGSLRVVSPEEFDYLITSINCLINDMKKE